MSLKERKEYADWSRDFHISTDGKNWNLALDLGTKMLNRKRETFGPRHPEVLQSLIGLANVARAARDYDTAMRWAQQAFELSQTLLGPHHPLTLSNLHELAVDTAENGFSAEQLNRHASDLLTIVYGERHPDTLLSLSNLAADLRDLNRYAEAELLDRRVLGLRTEVLGECHRETLASEGNLAVDLRSLDRLNEAEKVSRRTLALATTAFGELDPATLSSRNTLGLVLIDLGHANEAIPMFEQNLAISRKVGGPRDLKSILALQNQAVAYWWNNRKFEAAALFNEALKLAREARGERHPEVYRMAQNLALARLSETLLAADALPAVRLALSGMRWNVSQIADAGARGEIQQRGDKLFVQKAERLFADAAWARGAAFPAEASGLRVESFGALQSAGSGPAARAIAETAARRYAVEAGAGELVTERARQVELWAAAERRNIAAQAQSGGQDRAAREAMERDMAAAEARIKAIDAELKVKAPQYFAIVNQPPLDVAEAQGLLGDDEAVLIVVPSEFGTHVMALTKTELVWHRADIKADEVAEKVTALRRDLNPGEGARGPDAGLAYRPSFDRATAHDLYAKLIAPVAATLQSKSHLFIAADGALASLPFGVLVTEAPAAGSDDSDPEVLRATPWFADAHALVQIPSLQSLAYLRCFNTGDNRRPDGCPTSDTPARTGTTPSTRTTRTSASGFAGFGDPVLSGAAVKRGGRSAGALPPVDASGLTGRGVTEAGAPLMNPDELRALARLPGTRTELEAVGKLLGAPASAIRLDASMTETALRSANLSSVSILHLATHGLTASEAGQRGARTEPGLVFTPPAEATSQDDGYLAASEVLTLNLTAVDWVILSACNTAAPSGTPGEPGLSGLARAFFYAGAPSLLVSHWPVGDDVAAALTVNTLRRTQAGESRATALQNAMRDIRNDPTNPAFAHPSAWAPFTIAGEGR